MEVRSMRTLRRSPPPHHGDRQHSPGVEPDHISALPDEMLLLVLARLGCVHAAVQTSLLSRRWRGLWTGLTDLAFRRLKPATIEARLAHFTRSSVLSICDVILPYVPHVNSLLRSAARLSPGKLVFTILEVVGNHDKIEIPCLPSTTSIELDTLDLCLKPPPEGEFGALERLSISGGIVGLGDLLNRCPRLRVVSVVPARRDGSLTCVTPPPPFRELTALENLSLTGRIDGLYSLLNRCRHLRVLSVTYMDSRQLTLPSDGEFPILENLFLSGNITDLGTLLNRCPRLHVLRVAFRDVALESIEEALATLEEVVRLGLAVSLLGMDDIRNFDAARFTSLLRAVARVSPQEFAFKHFFHTKKSAHMPSFPRAISIAMDLNTSIRFARIPEAAADFLALERLSLTGGCRPVNLATMVSRCPLLRVLRVTVSTGKIKVHSASLEKLYASTGWDSDCRSIDIVAPVLKRLELEVREGGDIISVSISAPRLENVSWQRLPAYSDSMNEFWRLSYLSLDTAKDTRQLVLCISATKHLGAEVVFTKEIETLLLTDFSTLCIQIENMSGHLFGSLVLRLFGIHRIRAATKRLEVFTRCHNKAMRTCPVTCPCDETKNPGEQNISSTCLEEVEMMDFSGYNCDHDFLTRILRYSPMLKRVSLNLSSSGTCTTEVRNILLGYPSWVWEAVVGRLGGILAGPIELPASVVKPLRSRMVPPRDEGYNRWFGWPVRQILISRCPAGRHGVECALFYNQDLSPSDSLSMRRIVLCCIEKRVLGAQRGILLNMGRSVKHLRNHKVQSTNQYIL